MHLHQFSLPISIPSTSPSSIPIPIPCLLLKCRFKLSFLGNPPSPFFPSSSLPPFPSPIPFPLWAYLHPPTEQKYLFFVSWTSFWCLLTSFAVSKLRLQRRQCAGWVCDFLWRLDGIVSDGKTTLWTRNEIRHTCIDAGAWIFWCSLEIHRGLDGCR